MIVNLISLLFGSTLKKIAAIGLVMVLVVGFFQVKSCQHKNEQIRQLKADIKILEQDQKIDRQTEQKKDEVEEYNSPDDFDRGFNQLRNYGK